MNRSFEESPSLGHQRAERRPTPELAAYHWTNSGLQQIGIKDISSTGVYLLTEERWNPGAVVSLTLQRKGPPEKASERRISLKTLAVRWGEDGVGLSFVLPEGLDLRLWEDPLSGELDLTEPEFILREFRVADAIAFTSRIAPSASEEVTRLVREGLSNYRVTSAVEIALKAKEMLAARPDAERLRAHPRIVLRIFEDGSWAEADWMQQFWAGLLATSCTLDGNDDSNMVFVELLSQLAAMHIRILTAACSKATKVLSGIGSLASRPLSCSADELTRITGSRDLLRIHRDLEHLSDLGLITLKVSSSFLSQIEDAVIAPTSLGLKLYARCNGHRGRPQDFYGIDILGTHALADIQ